MTAAQAEAANLARAKLEDARRKEADRQANEQERLQLARFNASTTAYNAGLARLRTQAYLEKMAADRAVEITKAQKEADAQRARSQLQLHLAELDPADPAYRAQAQSLLLRYADAAALKETEEIVKSVNAAADQSEKIYAPYMNALGPKGLEKFIKRTPEGRFISIDLVAARDEANAQAEAMASKLPPGATMDFEIPGIGKTTRKISTGADYKDVMVGKEEEGVIKEQLKAAAAEFDDFLTGVKEVPPDQQPRIDRLKSALKATSDPESRRQIINSARAEYMGDVEKQKVQGIKAEQDYTKDESLLKNREFQQIESRLKELDGGGTPEEKQEYEELSKKQSEMLRGTSATGGEKPAVAPVPTSKKPPNALGLLKSMQEKKPAEPATGTSPTGETPAPQTPAPKKPFEQVASDVITQRREQEKSATDIDAATQSFSEMYQPEWSTRTKEQYKQTPVGGRYANAQTPDEFLSAETAKRTQTFESTLANMGLLKPDIEEAKALAMKGQKPEIEMDETTGVVRLKKPASPEPVSIFQTGY